jgi:hypothetical protein
MPQDRTLYDREPAQDAEGADGAGSVVVGIDLSALDGLVMNICANTELWAGRPDVTMRTFQQFRENMARAGLAAQQAMCGLSESLGHARPVRSESRISIAVPFGSDAMHWTPPADGKEIPSCPA